MKCPVCKTECHDEHLCPECGFSEVGKLFINQADARLWQSTIVQQYRNSYFEKFKDFLIEGTVLVKYIGKQKFVKVPSGITEIGRQSFWFDPKVERIELPPTVKKIAQHAIGTRAGVPFAINIPAELEYIDDWAFSVSQLSTFKVEIEKNSRYQIISNCLVDTIQHRLISVCGNYTSVPNCTLEKFCPVSMAAVNEIYTMVVPEGVTAIGAGCFAFCRNLTHVTLPSTLRSIGSNPFRGCKKLTSLLISPNNTHFVIQNEFLIEKGSRTLICSLNHHNDQIPANVESIGVYALYQRNLGDCAIPVNIREISGLSFSETTGNSVFIPKNVTTIGYNTFDESEVKYICCEAKEVPSSWNTNWLGECNAKVIWGVSRDDYERFYLR